MKLVEHWSMGALAFEIATHLKRFKRAGVPGFDRPAARPQQRRIVVWYTSEHRHQTLTRQEAVNYLNRLRDGFVGRHYEA